MQARQLHHTAAGNSTGHRRAADRPCSHQLAPRRPPSLVRPWRCHQQGQPSCLSHASSSTAPTEEDLLAAAGLSPPQQGVELSSESESLSAESDEERTVDVELLATGVVGTGEEVEDEDPYAAAYATSSGRTESRGRSSMHRRPPATLAGQPVQLEVVGAPNLEQFLADARNAANAAAAAVRASWDSTTTSSSRSGSSGHGEEAEEEYEEEEGEASYTGLQAAMAEAAAEAVSKVVTIERLEALFPFPLDNFQRRSVQQLLEGKSVVVCAPTGAGKTAIAEAAAAATLARGQRVIYTTPLKALSNQKLHETRARFGSSRCGLQTGDTSLNTDADIVVMTTEILRNIMYRTAETKGNSTSMSSREERLGDVGLIVLDEVHYLGDPWRGSVWEEAIINCPRHIQMLAMSATVKNPDDLGGWITQEHGECVTIKTRFRPVPLRWHFCYRTHNKASGGVLTDLLGPKDKGLNPRLDMRVQVIEEARELLAKSGRNVTDASHTAAYDAALSRLLDQQGAMLARRVMQRRVPSQDQVLLRLKAKQMLPAIWFILSRKDCDLSALKTQAVLTTDDEANSILQEVEALREDQPDAVREKFVAPLLRGVATHHAGCLPGWKSLVERLFQRGLLKLVFATGTLAAGINMPARTTIISSLGRRTDEGIVFMPHNELLQMAGRAGRRGYDTEGHCIIVQNRFEGAEEAWSILSKGPEPLTSQFTTSYGLVLNLLSVYTLEEAREFLARSFGHYMSGEGNSRRLQEIRDLEARIAELMADFKSDSTVGVKQATAAVKAERRKLKQMRAQALDQRCARAIAALSATPLPQPLLLNLALKDTDAPRLMPAVAFRVLYDPPLDAFVGKEPAREPFLACLAADNRLVAVSVAHVVGVEVREGTKMPALGSPAGAAAVGSTSDDGPSRSGVDDSSDVGSSSSSHVEALDGDASSSGDDAAGIDASSSSSSSSGGGSSVARTSGGASTSSRIGNSSSQGTTAGRAFWQAKVPELEAAWDQASARSKAWSYIAAGSPGVQLCVGSSATAQLAVQIGGVLDQYDPIQVDPELAQQIKEQQDKAKAAMDTLNEVRKAARRPSSSGKGGSNPLDDMDGMAMAKRLMRKAQRLKAEMDGTTQGTWRTFVDVMEILVAAGAMEEDTLKVLPLGLVARSLQGGNELWMALALTHPAVLELTPPQLAAYVGALLCSEVIKRPISVWSAYQVSSEVVDTIDALEDAREALFQHQSDAGLTKWNEYLLVDLRLAGIVEAWAAGAEWKDIISDCSLDDGDMARLLARTTDMLRQIAFNDALLPYMKDTARKALSGMDRKPVSDLAI